MGCLCGARRGHGTVACRRAACRAKVGLSACHPVFLVDCVRWSVRDTYALHRTLLESLIVKRGFALPRVGPDDFSASLSALQKDERVAAKPRTYLGNREDMLREGNE